jgi:uncharacterized membrane protein
MTNRSASPAAPPHGAPTHAPAGSAEEVGGVGKGRLETLCDGIFAIVMTLLVLELSSPALSAARSAPEVGAALAALWPKFVSYLISFVLVGIFWVAHHTQFHFIRRTDRRHIWINMILMLCLSFVPFSAALLGAHYDVRAAEVVYGVNVIAAGVALVLNWWYATHRGLVAHVPERARRAIERRLLAGHVAYPVAVATAFIAPSAAFALYVLFALGYVVAQLLPEAGAGP